MKVSTCPANEGSVRLSWYPHIPVVNTNSPSAISSEPNRLPSYLVPSARSRIPRDPLGCSGRPESRSKSAASGNVGGESTPRIPAPGQKPPSARLSGISNAAQVRFLMVDREYGFRQLQIHSSSSLITIFPLADGTTFILAPENRESFSTGPSQEFRNTASAATSECGWFPTETL